MNKRFTVSVNLEVDDLVTGVVSLPTPLISKCVALIDRRAEDWGVTGEMASYVMDEIFRAIKEEKGLDWLDEEPIEKILRCAEEIKKYQK